MSLTTGLTHSLRLVLGASGFPITTPISVTPYTYHILPPADPDLSIPDNQQLVNVSRRYIREGLMPGPFVPNDDLVGGVVHQLALIIASQMPAITRVYEKLPDQQPQDNSVIIPLSKIQVKEETNGKQKVVLQFGIRHLFRRKNISDNITQAQTYVHPWLLMMAAWPNQTLGGLSRDVSVRDVQITQVSESATPMLALIINVDVGTEYNVPLT